MSHQDRERRDRSSPLKKLMPLTLFVTLILLIATACGDLDEENGDDNDIEDHPTVEVGDQDDDADNIDGSDDTDDQDNGSEVPPLFEIADAESDDGERTASAIRYGQQPTEQMDALMEGELSLNGECLGVSVPGGGEFATVVWPSGFSVKFDNGDVVLLDGEGEILAREGDPVSLGGGNSPDQDGEIADIAPDDCISDGYWMSGSEVRRLAPEVEPDPAIDDDLTVYFPQWQDEDQTDPQSFGGRLVHENDCLYLDHETGGQQRLAIWPPDWSVETDGEEVVVLDENDEELARTGDILSVESRNGQFDVDEYAIPGGCHSMHTMIFALEVTGGPDDEMPEAEVQTEEEARETDAQHYADAFGVELDEALRRMDLQSKLGSEGHDLEVGEPDRFGGLFWEHEPEYRLVVQMTDGDEETVREYIQDPELQDVLDVRTVEYTHEELLDTQHEVMSLLHDLGVRVSGGISVQENRVEVYAADASVVEEALESAGEELPESVTIVESEKTDDEAEAPADG
jgi:hypothetical protein